MLCNKGMGQTVAGGPAGRNPPWSNGFDTDVVAAIKTGDMVKVDTDTGEVEIISRSE